MNIRRVAIVPVGILMLLLLMILNLPYALWKAVKMLGLNVSLTITVFIHTLVDHPNRLFPWRMYRRLGDWVRRGRPAH